jgi:hypothetical protein
VGAQAKLFRMQHPETNLLDMTGNALEEAWLSWVQIEVKKKACSAYHGILPGS